MYILHFVIRDKRLSKYFSLPMLNVILAVLFGCSTCVLEINSCLKWRQTNQHIFEIAFVLALLDESCLTRFSFVISFCCSFFVHSELSAKMKCPLSKWLSTCYYIASVPNCGSLCYCLVHLFCPSVFR